MRSISWVPAGELQRGDQLEHANGLEYQLHVVLSHPHDFAGELLRDRVVSHGSVSSIAASSRQRPG